MIDRKLCITALFLLASCTNNAPEKIANEFIKLNADNTRAIASKEVPPIFDSRVYTKNLSRQEIPLINVFKSDMTNALMKQTKIGGEDTDIPYSREEESGLKAFTPVDISNYYKKVPGNFIVPNMERIRSNGENTLYAKRSFIWNKVILPDANTQEAFERTQDYFNFDTPRFVEFMGTEDLKDARIRYYRNLFYDPKAQQHVRPYYYMHSWGGLFHPPVKELTEKWSHYYKGMDSFGRFEDDSPFFDPDLQKRLDKVSNTELTSGNKLKLLLNKESYAAKLQLIRSAKRYLLVTVMVFVCDGTTKPLVDEIIAARKRGVEVKVMVEGVEELLSLGCTNRLYQGDVDILNIYGPLEMKKGIAVMHNKFWIRDGEEAILGGMNMLDTENTSNGFNFKNRDTDVHVEGPIVTDLMSAFARNWNLYKSYKYNSKIERVEREITIKRKREIIKGERGQKYYADWLANKDTRSTGLCRVASQIANADKQPIVNLIYNYVRNSRNQIMISSPTIEYQLGDVKDKKPNDIVMDMIKHKAKDSNIQVDIVTNGYGGGMGELEVIVRGLYEKAYSKGWNNVSNALEDFLYKKHLDPTTSQYQNFEDLSKVPNLNLWLYFQYMHAKTYLFDRLVTGIGSWNFDIYSSDRAFETMMFCMDDSLRDELEGAFVRDITNSIPYKH